MKILVFSDSHGKFHNIKKALELHPDAEYIFHLGDGIKDIEALGEFVSGKGITLIKGNFEDYSISYSSYSSCCITELCGKKIFACHGHRYSVKNSKYFLIDSAVQNNADIILFGHTHTRYYEYLSSDSLESILVDRSTGKPKYNRNKGIYIFNPGSISLPRDHHSASYGIIEIKENGVLFSHGNIGALTK